MMTDAEREQEHAGEQLILRVLRARPRRAGGRREPAAAGAPFAPKRMRPGVRPASSSWQTRRPDCFLSAAGRFG